MPYRQDRLWRRKYRRSPGSGPPWWGGREQNQVGILGEHVHQGAAALFQTEGDRAAVKALLQSHGPNFYCLWGVVQFPLFCMLGAGRDQSPEVLLVCPVDGRKRGPFPLGGYRWQRIRHGIDLLLKRAGLAPTK